MDEDLIEKPPNIKMISKEAELTVNKNSTFYYLLIDSLSWLDNLPNIGHNPDGMATHYEDHDIDADPGQ